MQVEFTERDMARAGDFVKVLRECKLESRLDAYPHVTDCIRWFQAFAMKMAAAAEEHSKVTATKAVPSGGGSPMQLKQANLTPSNPGPKPKPKGPKKGKKK